MQVSDRDCTLQSSDRDCTLELNLRAQDTHKQAVVQDGNTRDLEAGNLNKAQEKGKDGRNCFKREGRVRKGMVACAVVASLIICLLIIVPVAVRYH